MTAATSSKPKLDRVTLVRDYIADSAKAALDKAAEWLEGGFIVRTYPAQTPEDEDDFSWVVEAYDPRQ